ncbi:hypothetical protein IMY05_009G0096100 [Salix suchowensis]|nr:hypothetical protein IMY05_009G0096100 [Salix suchowensis]
MARRIAPERETRDVSLGDTSARERGRGICLLVLIGLEKEPLGSRKDWCMVQAGLLKPSFSILKRSHLLFGLASSLRILFRSFVYSSK